MKYSDIIKPGELQILHQYDALAHKVANNYMRKLPGTHFDYEDLYQWARLGILNSHRTFNHNKDVKFLTHAYNQASFSISHYLRADTGLIRIPHSKLTNENIKKPSYTDITELHDREQHPVFESYNNIDLRNIIDQYSINLNQKQKDVINMYYVQGLTLDEIASRMKIARQAIDSHHQKAIKILRQCFVEDKIDRSVLGV